MGVLRFLLHPNQLRSIIQWKLWHEPVHRRDPTTECESLAICFDYLDKTSRSFSAVIKELHPELLVPVCLFYLVLRGLDTIEDDPTIEYRRKDELLRTFHTHLLQDGWTFTESGPNEKDRDLLVHFDNVIVEMKKIKPAYFDIISDITVKMETGMAEFVLLLENNPDGIRTIGDYKKYCHYAAGVVGEGLTRLFVEAELANPSLLDQPDLAESMGQLLQQTNVIRDIREDWDDHRRWWPREVWSKYVDRWEDMFDPVHREKAMQCTSELVLIGLRNVEDCLLYMAGIRDQSVFNFVAIPQSMAIATLELVFRNPAMFDRNIKISKGDACQLMLESTQSLAVVCETFRRYSRKIHQKNDPRDPNYCAISVQCAKIEQFIESLFPTRGPGKAKNQKQEEPSTSLSDALLIIVIVIGSLLFVSVMMVGTAYFCAMKFGPHSNPSNAEWAEHDAASVLASAPIAGGTTATTTTTMVVHGEL